MVARVAIDLALDRLFDYEVPEALEGKLAVGQLLSVPFGHREARGFVMEIGGRGTGDGERVLKPVSAIVDETPFFSPALIDLARKVAEYTASPIESVLRAAVPAAVMRRNARAREQLFVEPALVPSPVELTRRQRWLYDQVVRLGGGWMTQLVRELGTTPAALKALGLKGLVGVSVRARRRDPLAGRRILPSKPLALNPEQSAALAAVGELGGGGPSTLLLYGVTGSGKTEVYLQAIAKELEAGRGTIVLVPEISLTPQTVSRFASRFGDMVAVLHSALSDGERYDEWHRIRSGAARVAVGPRSAVWAPVKDLGLIVVDEEHEPSYKQEDNPRYSARDVAVLRGAVEGAKVVLGSATPSLESWRNAETGKYRLASITRRAGAGTLPGVRLVDLGEDGAGGAIFSRDLIDAISLRLDRGEQTILFLNRRGFSRQYVCAACGWTELPAKCPDCGGAEFACQGIGTQRAEAALRKCFPRASVLRMDADSTSRRSSHDDILGAFRRGEADILVGTQMIAKGLDFPNVTLVGVLNADSTLSLPDFRASERAFQLFAQVSGRAGRAELPGEVLIQTRNPADAVLRAVVAGDFAKFAARELEDRREAFFPPFCHLSVVNLKSKDLHLAADWAAMYAKSLQLYAARLRQGRMLVSEAVPSALEKADGYYRWQVVVRSTSAAAAVRAWRWISSARPPVAALRVAIDIDAVNLV